MASRSAAMDVYNQDTSIENTFKLRSLRQNSIDLDPNKNLKVKDVNLNFNTIFDEWKQNQSILNLEQQGDNEKLQCLFDHPGEKFQLPDMPNQRLRAKKISSLSTKKIHLGPKDESPLVRLEKYTSQLPAQGKRHAWYAFRVSMTTFKYTNHITKHIQNVHHRKRCEKSAFESRIKQLIESDTKNYEEIKSMKMSQNQYLQSLCRPKKKRRTQSTQPTLNRFASIRSDSQEYLPILPKIADGNRSIFSGLH